MYSFQNAWPTKRKAAYSLVLFYNHFLVACDNQIGSQAVYFLILVNLQTVAGGKKCCFRR